MKTAFEGLDDLAVGHALERLRGDGLDHGQGILQPVADFPVDQRLLGLGALAVGNVGNGHNRACQAAARVMHRFGGDGQPGLAAVAALIDDLEHGAFALAGDDAA